MEFYINKNSTLPILKLELIKDGRNDYKKFYEIFQNSNISFSMTDIDTGLKRICGAEGLCIYKEPLDADCILDEYYIGYQFSAKETSKAGRYVGEFNIEFLDGSGTLIVPIRDTLFINVLDHGIKK